MRIPGLMPVLMALVVAWAALSDRIGAAADLSTTTQISCIQAITIHDTARNKDLICRVTYPAQAVEPCPVIIFSHGALGSKDGYAYLADYLARHGYVCIQPTHEDSLSYVNRGDRLAYATSFLRDLPNNVQAWDSRTRDISFIIDSLSSFSKKCGIRLDAHHIACGGHSLGAFTAALIAGAQPPAPSSRKDYRDPRVSVAVLMSPQGNSTRAGQFGFESNAWQHVHIPVLFMTGTLDATKYTSAQGRQTGFFSCPPGDKYSAVIDGASHMTFSGRGGQESGAFQRFLQRRIAQMSAEKTGQHERMLDDICRVTTCFLDAYLRNDQQSKMALAQPGTFDALVKMSAR